MRAPGEPKTPPRSAISATAAAGSTAAPGSPRSMPSASRSPLVHGRTAAGPSGASRRDAPAAGGGGAGGSGAADDGTDTPGFGQGLIAAAACFLLRQETADAPAGALVAGQIPIDPVRARRECVGVGLSWRCHVLLPLGVCRLAHGLLTPKFPPPA